MRTTGEKQTASLWRVAWLTMLALPLQFGQARALEGGSRARADDQLAQATVVVGTILQPGDGLHLSRCTGILIAPDEVLTAAHCVRNNPVRAAVFFYRGSRPTQPPYPVAAITRYPVAPGRLIASGSSSDLAGALNEISGDVAVLRLARPAKGRRPVRLAFDPQHIPSMLQLAGAGLSGRTVGTLRTAPIRALGVTPAGVIIASTMGARACLGDSGGPVVARGRHGLLLVGVASAVMTPSAPCGNVLMVAPARLNALGM